MSNLLIPIADLSDRSSILTKQADAKTTHFVLIKHWTPQHAANYLEH